MSLATARAGPPSRLLMLGAVLCLAAPAVLAPRVARAGDVPDTATLSPTAEPDSATTQPTIEEKAKGPELPSARFPLSGEVSLGSSVASGSFVAGEGNRTGIDGFFSLRAVYQFMPGLSLSASELVYHNFVTNADSGAARPYDTDFLDPFFTLAFSPQVSAPDGSKKPFELPGGIRIGANLTARPPLSRASRFANQYFAAGPGLSLSRPNLFGMLSLALGTSIVKNFNKYTNASVDASEFRAMGRPGGAEVLSGDLIATSTVNISFYLRHSISASLQITDRVNFSLIYLLINNFTENAPAADQYTSKYARSGAGRADSQWGIASLTVGIDKASHSTVSLSTYTISAPFSADNSTYRFPFWDFRSTADNYSSVNLSLTQSF